MTISGMNHGESNSFYSIRQEYTNQLRKDFLHDMHLRRRKKILEELESARETPCKDPLQASTGNAMEAEGIRRVVSLN